MPKLAPAPSEDAPLPDLTDAEIGELIAVEHWAPLGPPLDQLIEQIPQTGDVLERTTLLTWVYQQQGVMSFCELVDRFNACDEVLARRAKLRTFLRGLERLFLISIVNFPGKPVAPDKPLSDSLGDTSVISLTWTGMVWMRRAWAARARLAGQGGVMAAHRSLIEEEDAGKCNDPFWVENIGTIDPQGPRRRMERIQSFQGIASVFDLGRKKRR